MWGDMRAKPCALCCLIEALGCCCSNVLPIAAVHHSSPFQDMEIALRGWSFGDSGSKLKEHDA
jgi:hypothetical protein